MSTTEEFEETANAVFSCKKCAKTFASKRDQLLHKREVHNPTRSSHECKLCHKFFCNNGNLERHMKVHNDVRPFECKICHKSFAQAVNLQRHFSVHTGERPYQCQFCTKAFTQQSNLQRHQLTHTGEKPFRCKRCGRYFSQRSNLKKHIMGHLETKPYQCSACSKSFIQLSNLKKHLNSHSKEGMNLDVETILSTAIAAAKQTMQTVSNPVAVSRAFECAICRIVFMDFASFEAHETECNAGKPRQLTASGPTAPGPTLNHHHQGHPNLTEQDFTDMKFMGTDMNTPEIIIETSG